MTTWEYEIYDLDSGGVDDEPRSLLNEAGEDGWDLVAVVKQLAYFKRRVENEPEFETLTASISSFDNFEEVIEKAIKFIERVSRVAKVFIPTEDE